MNNVQRILIINPSAEELALATVLLENSEANVIIQFPTVENANILITEDDNTEFKTALDKIAESVDVYEEVVIVGSSISPSKAIAERLERTVFLLVKPEGFDPIYLESNSESWCHKKTTHLKNGIHSKSINNLPIKGKFTSGYNGCRQSNRH